MRNVITLCAIVILVSVTFVSDSYAQSGSRGGGSRSSGGGSRASSSGGSRSASGGSRTRARRPSPAELQRLAEQQQKEAQRLAKLQDDSNREQLKQTLAQLALRENRSANTRQLREAFREATRDFKRLRSGKQTPEQVSVLQVPFRLSDKDIDRSDGTVQWPEALRADQFNELTESLETILSDGISSKKSAKKFFGELGALNSALNQAAVNQEIKSSKYAKARRFVTGLANEVRATKYGDATRADQKDEEAEDSE